ncbi:MAG TPA: hypothetical protein VGG19_02165 [Tepidisphaeraceae bacterium]|jgi:hypothetical protein
MNQPTKRSDSIVSEEDFISINAAIKRERYANVVSPLMEREPELAVNIARRNDRLSALLDGAAMSPETRLAIRRQILFLSWVPLLALDHAHRRQWDDFLPAETTDPQTEGDTHE